MSLLEAVLSMGIFSVLLGAVAAASLSASGAYEVGATMADLEERARRTLDRIAKELQDSGVDTLLPAPLAPFGSESLSFQRSEGIAGGAVQWGDAATIEFRYDPADGNDGLDNNTNGVVDEGRVVWVRSAGLPDEMTVVLSHSVREYLEGEEPNGLDDNGNGLIDEKGLCFDLMGNTLRVRLTLQHVGPEGEVLTRTAETSVRMRN